jgi:hypothetical protein
MIKIKGTAVKKFAREHRWLLVSSYSGKELKPFIVPKGCTERLSYLTPAGVKVVLLLGDNDSLLDTMV